MKAFILEFPGNFAAGELQLPFPQKDEILLRITHCAICRTDAKMCIDGHRDLITPRIPGHEICAVDPSSGLRYAIWPGDSCGNCFFCLKGEDNLCPKMKIIGFHRDGGLSEFISVKYTNLIELPPDMPGEVAVFAEPLACAINLKEQLNAQIGDKIMIYGAGTMGLLIGLVLSLSGFDSTLCEISKDKLSLSSDFRRMTGIKALLAEELGDAKEDAAVNATSSPEAVSDAFHRLRSGGKFCFFSGIHGNSSSDMKILNEIHYRQLKTTGAYGCTPLQMKEALDILSREGENVRLLVQQRIGLEEVGRQLHSIYSGGMLKTIVGMNK